MVWALIESGGFDEFFPDSDMQNDYGKWHDRLAVHFDQMPPDLKAKYDNDFATYNYVVSSKFTKEFGSRVTDAAPPIGPLEPHERPEEFITNKNYTSLGSIIKLTDRLLAVDEPLKEIIYRLEPGVHDFWQMIITMPKGAVYPMQFYGMVIGRFLETFAPEKSADGIVEKSGLSNFSIKRDQKSFVSGLAISKSAVGSSHLWRERRLKSPNIFFSDTLQAEIAKARLKLPKHFRVKEVE